MGSTQWESGINNPDTLLYFQREKKKRKKSKEKRRRRERRRGKEERKGGGRRNEIFISRKIGNNGKPPLLGRHRQNTDTREQCLRWVQEPWQACELGPRARGAIKGMSKINEKPQYGNDNTAHFLILNLFSKKLRMSKNRNN